MNRRKHTTARQSTARIMTAALWAGAATLAAVAWTACASTSARWTDEATAKAAAYIVHGTPCTIGEIDAAPRAVTAAKAPRDRHPAASARVLDFARGYADTVDERDRMDASPAAIRAAVDSGRLD